MLAEGAGGLHPPQPEQRGDRRLCRQQRHRHRRLPPLAGPRHRPRQPEQQRAEPAHLRTEGCEGGEEVPGKLRQIQQLCERAGRPGPRGERLHRRADLPAAGERRHGEREPLLHDFDQQHVFLPHHRHHEPPGHFPQQGGEHLCAAGRHQRLHGPGGLPEELRQGHQPLPRPELRHRPDQRLQDTLPPRHHPGRAQGRHLHPGGHRRLQGDERAAGV